MFDFAVNATGIAFSHDGVKLAVSDCLTPLNFWDLTSGKELPTWARNDVRPGNLIVPNISRVAFAPDGKVAVHANFFTRQGTWSPEIVFWDSAQGKELYRMPLALPDRDGNHFAVGNIAFSPNGAYLAAPDATGEIVLFDTCKGIVVKRLTTIHRNNTPQLAFSPDGRFLAVGTSPWSEIRANYGLGGDPPGAPVVELCEVASGKLRDRFLGHTGDITCLAYSPDGSTLASGSEDTTVILWDLTGNSGSKLPMLADADFPAAWNSLRGDNAKLSVTIRRLVQSPGTVAFLKQNFHPVKAPDLSEKAIDKLVSDLGAQGFKTRDQATTTLHKLAERAEPALQRALAGNPPVEARRRIANLLDALARRQMTAEELQAIRGIEVLERIGSIEARELLTAIAAGDPAARGTQQAAAALKRLRRK